MSVKDLSMNNKDVEGAKKLTAEQLKEAIKVLEC